MSKTVYFADSFPWLTRQLRGCDPPDPGLAVMVGSRSEAEVIIFPKTDKREPDPGDRLRDLTPRELMRTCVFSQLDEPFPWAPGMYASLSAGHSKRGFVGGFYVAQHHLEEGGIGDELERVRATEPNLLWSFMGTASNHPVRGRLFELHDDLSEVRDTQRWSDTIRRGWKTQHRDEARTAFSGYAELVGRSRFVVCPRGRGASSIRLFEALQVGRPPVIVSDDWLPPPFVDWETCSVRIAEQDLDRLPQVLREREAEAGVLGERAREVWERYFAPRRQLSTLVAGCLLATETAPPRPWLLAQACLRRQALRRGLRRIRDVVPSS
jgi:hypothetical protein